MLATHYQESLEACRESIPKAQRENSTAEAEVEQALEGLKAQSGGICRAGQLWSE